MWILVYKCTFIHEELTFELSRYVEEARIREWMEKWKTTLIQKQLNNRPKSTHDVEKTNRMD